MHTNPPVVPQTLATRPSEDAQRHTKSITPTPIQRAQRWLDRYEDNLRQDRGEHNES